MNSEKSREIMMKNLQTILLFLLVAISTMSCQLLGIENRDVESYVVKVDSVNVASQVNFSDTLSVHLFGTIGPNGCHSFKRFDKSSTSSKLALKVIGEVVKGDNLGCTDAIVQLDRIFQVEPPLQDPFEINIEQPDGSVLERTVEVTN